MPMPKLLARINKRVFNPIELKRGKRPVLRHVGRKSGQEYRTPLDTFEVDSGYMFVLVYGTDSDWCQNIMASGEAILEIDGDEITLATPRVVDRNAAQELLSAKLPGGSMKIDEFLVMDEMRQAGDVPPAATAGTEADRG